jgi:hypothetical protein
VAEEVGRLLPADFTIIGRYEPDGAGWTGMGGWSRVGEAFGVGRTVPLGGESVAARVHETGRTAQMDSYESASGSLAADARAAGLDSSVGVPITVAGRLWGVMIASSTCETELPAGTARRLADFTELVATAIANAEAHAEVTASRAIVATADQTRRRIQGDLRELSRGIHPAILTEGGLNPALRALVRRSPIPVELQVQLGSQARLPEPVEVTAYYVTAEALTNVAKHASASVIQVDLDAEDGIVRLGIRDDGVGGADPTRGSGLIGLRDRVEAIRGSLQVDSRPGHGTSLQVTLPVDAGQPPHSTP